MKLKDVKESIDTYFLNTSAEELLDKLEKYGVKYKNCPQNISKSNSSSTE